MDDINVVIFWMSQDPDMGIQAGEILKAMLQRPQGEQAIRKLGGKATSSKGVVNGFARANHNLDIYISTILSS